MIQIPGSKDSSRKNCDSKKKEPSVKFVKTSGINLHADSSSYVNHILNYCIIATIVAKLMFSKSKCTQYYTVDRLRYLR